MSRKSNTALLSVGSNTTLIVMKFIVGVLTGSVSIISEAIHSMMDLVAAIVAFFSVRMSDKPPDEKHPYGHDKIENISGLVEALLIFIAAFWIILEAVKKIMHPEELRNPGIGFIVMFLSAGVNILVSRRLYKVAKEEDSLALEADALHLKADVITSAGVGAGLLVIWLSKLYFLDSALAILVALFILREAFLLLMKAFEPLLDAALSDDEIAVIRKTMDNHLHTVCDYHELRTRKAGKTRHIDMHVTMPPDRDIKTAHDAIDAIELDLERQLHHTKVLIHVEPCGKTCEDCRVKG